MGMARNLTKKQQTFLSEYIKTGNGMAALLKAYPTAKNWTYNAQHTEINKLLNKPLINLKLKEHNEKAAEKLANSTALNKRKLLETALQMLQDTNNPQERGHAVNLIKLLFNKEGMTSPEQSAINVNVTNNNIMADISNYLDI